MPSPVAVSGLVVYRYTLPAPPVARMVCGARKASTSSVSSSSAYRPWHDGSASPSLVPVTRSTSVWCSNSVMLGVRRTRSISTCCTAAPVASVTCTMRRWLWPPSRVRCRSPPSSEKGTPSSRSQPMACGAPSTTKRVASGSHRPAPATSVSSTWASKLSPAASTAAMPPCAQALEPSFSARLVSTATRCVGARCSAAERPARPLPTIRTSKSRTAEVTGVGTGWVRSASRPAGRRWGRRPRPA
ncbi:hypothetical protein FQZ97_669070 [compost metagenome]